LRRNEQIRISPLRVVGPDNEVIGIVSNDDALRMARDLGLDLVEVAANVRPPVCRIMDYGKWKYLQKKKGTKGHEQQLKEVRLRPRTDDHDLEIKVKQAQGFLEKGHKIQFTMRFRGRERAHREIALRALQEILSKLSDRVKVERPAAMDGRNMVMILSPLKGASKSSSGTEPSGGSGAHEPRPPRPPANSAAMPAMGADATPVTPRNAVRPAPTLPTGVSEAAPVVSDPQMMAVPMSAMPQPQA
jgi:translation initiation factor IF-3